MTMLPRVTTIAIKLDMGQIVRVLRATAKHLAALADDLEEA